MDRAKSIDTPLHCIEPLALHRRTGQSTLDTGTRTMPQLATSMSVPLSCPLYLDLNSALHSENNFKSFFEMPDSSKSMLDMSLLYENLVKSQPNMCSFNPSLLAESFNYYLNQSCRNGDKSTSPKSFSIESILGFSNSPPSKDVFCNQLTFHDFSPLKNGHYSIPEFANNSESYRPLQGSVHQSTIVKEHMPNVVESAITTGTTNCNGRPMDKFHGTLKNYPGLNRKSGKSFKSTSKSLNSNQCKSKRVRTIFTAEQLERLETEFERQQYMVGSGRHYLASTLNLSEAQVKVWFQNRRIKWRKQHLEGHQENGVKEEKELL